MAPNDQLIVKYMPLVRKIAHKLAIACGRDKAELEDAGMIGLVEAGQRYDPTRGIEFSRSVSSRIRGAILDALRKDDPLTRTERRKRSRDSTRSEIGPGSYFLATRELNTDAVLERTVCGRSAATQTMCERARTVERLIAQLPYRLRCIMRMYYLEEKNDKEIGAVLGVTDTRICQLRREAMERLRTIATRLGVTAEDLG